MSVSEDEGETIIISRSGDLLLQVKDQVGDVQTQYRVCAVELMRVSGYFKTILTTDFKEGIEFKKATERLVKDYSEDLSSASLGELPCLSLSFPVGLTSKRTILTSIKIFLQYIHQDSQSDKDENQGEWLMMWLSTDIDLFAHLAALVDQLDAVQEIKHFAEQILQVQPKCAGKPRKGDRKSERYWRQLLYISFLVGDNKSFRTISGTLILHGFEEIEERDPDAPWLNLRNDLEEELEIRRDGLFNTIASIPNYLLKAYMQVDKSKPAICKLGWSNSPQCDSYQLGEATRWLCRRKIVSPNLPILYASASEDPPVPPGNPKALIKVLREFPDYQIDVNHNRCGMRGKLIQHLDVIERMISDPKKVGICLECWHSGSIDIVSWSLNRRSHSGPYQGILPKDLSKTVKQTEGRRKAISTQTNEGISALLSSHASDGGTDQHVDAVPSSDEAPADYVRPSRFANDCLFVHDHELYANVFHPEKWTEKQWLLSDEKPSEPWKFQHLSLPSSPRSRPRRRPI